MNRHHRIGLAFLAAASVAGLSHATVFLEVESNDTKATSNIVAGMIAGDSIVGTSTSSTGAGVDYFDVTLAPAPLAIYRHQLQINSTTPGHSASIRGVNQNGAPLDTIPGIPWDGVVGSPTNVEASLQATFASTTPPRFSQWYGFGKGERFHYRITGTSSTTSTYNVRLFTSVVTPVYIGNFNSGLITISTFAQGHSTDTDFWVYDSNLDPIPGYGNDDEDPAGGSPGTGATLQGWLARNYAPGTYYIAMSNFNVANDLASPSDDGFRTGGLMEFPGIVLNSSTTTNLNLAFTVTDSTGVGVSVPNTKVGAYDINWFYFTVPEPGTASVLVLVTLGLLRRRR
jgi:hypothetical protein